MLPSEKPGRIQQHCSETHRIADRAVQMVKEGTPSVLVFDVPAAKVLRLDREASDEMVKKLINTTEVIEDELRLVSERVWEESD